jgi:DNA/RNA-binding domain of Phe-tRNA-synthetase-like protein
MTDEVSLSPAAGFIEPQLQDEFPGLRLDWLTLAVRPGHSPPSLVRRLRALSTGYRGASVVAMRTKPIPQAFRIFFRHIGLDPDVTRVPSEAAAVARLLHGEFRSAGLIADACLVALIETGVPVWALDADVVDEGGLGIRFATAEDLADEAARGLRLSPGSLVVGDRSAVHAALFGEQAAGRAVGPRTRRVVLYSVGVDGVPAIHIEEALWTCVEALR